MDAPSEIEKCLRFEKCAGETAGLRVPPAERSLNEFGNRVELAQVRAQGWAYSDGERASGVSALAAPIFEVGNKQVGALTLVVPAARLGEEQRTRYIPLVQEAARRASYDLGYAK